MHLIFQLALSMAVAAATLGQSAYAEGSAVYVATYIDVMPNAVASGATLLYEPDDVFVAFIDYIKFHETHKKKFNEA